MISWEICRQEFTPDGALRDIYIFGTSVQHWRKLFNILTSIYTLEYRVDGNVQNIPSSVDEIFDHRSRSHPLIRFKVSGASVACHFFSSEQIELDVDPREINSKRSFEAVTGLMKLIGDGLNKRVVMTHENDEQHPFLSYDSSKSEFAFFPCLTTP